MKSAHASTSSPGMIVTVAAISNVVGARRIAARREPLGEPFAVERVLRRREEQRQPAVADLGRQGDVLRPLGGEVDRDRRAQRVDRRLERLAEPGATLQRDVVVVAVELDGCLAGDDPAHDLDVLAGPCRAASDTARRTSPRRPAGPDAPRPRMNRPPDRWSSDIAAIAVAAGVRADICMIAVPSLIRSVCAPHQASGVTASEPYASAVQTESKPRRSASLIGLERAGGRTRRPVAGVVAELDVTHSRHRRGARACHDQSGGRRRDRGDAVGADPAARARGAIHDIGRPRRSARQQVGHTRRAALRRRDVQRVRARASANVCSTGSDRSCGSSSTTSAANCGIARSPRSGWSSGCVRRLHVDRPRRPTRPTKGSVDRRIQSKKQRAETKSQRRRPPPDD